MMADLISRRCVTPIAQAIIYPLALGFVALLAPAADAVLLHEYLFNSGNANDTAAGGTAHGTLNGNAAILAGQLVLDGSANTTVSLPGAAIAINTYPAVTIEAWATPSAAMTGFTTLLGFGQVNTADATLAGNYFILQTHRGDNTSRAAISISNDATPFSEEDFANGPEYNDGLQHQYVAVLDPVIVAVTHPNPTISLYTDGTLRQTAIYPVNGAANMISGISTEFARIGTSYPADPLFIGTVNQVRIYNEARTGGQIGTSFILGTTGAAGPTLTIDRGTGTLTLSNAQPSSSLVGYSIASAAGSLNQASWSSIADNRDADSGGSFDNDDVWTKLSAAGSKTDFSEFDFDGTPGNGGAFGAGGTTSIPIGSAGAWRKSIYEDLQVEMRLANGTDVPVNIKYTGNSNLPYKRSDLNFSGVIDVTDWNIFLANAGASFSTMSKAESYAFGDMNGDLVSNRLDFRLFKDDYNIANGSGSFEALSAVPEPSTLAMLVLACAAFVPRRVRRGLTMDRPQTYLRLALLSIVAVLVTFVGQADAALRNRYRFNEGVTADASNRAIIDSVSGANGVVKGAGSSGTANHLTLAGGASTAAAYIDLPNGLISSLGDATFETWYTIDSSQNWSRIWDFGSSTAPTAVNGELTAPGGVGNANDQLFFAAQRAGDIATQRIGLGNQDPLFLGANAGVANGYQDFDPEFPQVLGQKVHSAVVIDTNGAGAGQATLSFYLNGALVVDAGGLPNPEPINFALANLNDVNNWLGRSNWTADANFGGSFEEFRIYDSALSETQIATDFVLGEDLVGTNAVSLEVNKTTGVVKLKNNVPVNLPIEHYQITSAGGALNTAGWTSIDGVTAPGVGWDKAGGSNINQLIELYLPEGGFTFPALGELTLGTAFNPAVFGAGVNGDLAFTIGHAAGAVLSGSVDYITSVPVGVAGDYNGDNVVNAADYAYWRDRLGQTSALPNTNPLDVDGVVTIAEYNFWKTRFGATSGSGGGSAGSAGGVPEPSSWLLIVLGTGLGLLTTAGWRRARNSTCERRHAMPTNTGSLGWRPAVVALLFATLLSASASAATKDRFYQFGDDPNELPVVGQPPNTNFGAFTGDSAVIAVNDYQDLTGAGGGPLYVNTQATSRPGAVVGEWGLGFDGVDDRVLLAAGGLGSPAVGDDQPSYGTVNFTGITTRLIDGWVRPTNAAAGHRQDIVNDTTQFGLFTSADNKWGFVEGTTTITSTAAVAFNQWTHVMHRTYTNDAAALYVNGVAVAATGNNYNAAPPTTAPTLDIVFGASTDQTTNFFQGQLDNFSIYVSGNNTGQVNGRDYGTVNIATENDFIRQQLIGKQLGDVNLSGGAPDATDISIFVANWLKVRQVNGVNVGADLTSRMAGDFNFNGVVDVDDAYTLHAGLVAAGAGGLDFSLLGRGVPEPSSLVLAACALAALAGRRRRCGMDSCINIG